MEPSTARLEPACHRSGARKGVFMRAIGTKRLAGLLVLAILSSCGVGGGGGGGKQVNDQQTAQTFAWAVESALMRLAPYSSDATWSGTVKPGLVSGTATLTGSFTGTYDAYSGVSTDSYDVEVVFSDFADEDTYPHLTGTVVLVGTCTTYRDWSTTYSGSWEALGDPLTLGGPFSGQASIYLEWLRAGLDWGAVVAANGQQWQYAP
jgi:hypothetical protein